MARHVHCHLYASASSSSSASSLFAVLAHDLAQCNMGEVMDLVELLVKYIYMYTTFSLLSLFSELLVKYIYMYTTFSLLSLFDVTVDR